MQPDLTICIPTYNRLPYLKEMLLQIFLGSESTVRVRVIDNGSNDGTWDWLNGVARKSFPSVLANQQYYNVGPFKNQLDCVLSPSTKYVWLICDDELVMPGAVDAVCEAIKSGDDIYLSSLGEGSIHQFADHYSSPALFFEHAHRFDPRYLLAVGGWSHCVFKKEAFDFAAYHSSRSSALKYPSSYPHHYALWSGHRSVGVIKRQLVRGRDPVLPPPDGKVPEASSDIQWAKCVSHINSRYGLNIPLDILSKTYSKHQVGPLFTDPIGTIRRYAPMLTIPRNWPRVFNRLWHYFAR